MKTFDTILNEISNVLSSDQLQLLKDTINYGGWGDAEINFKNEDGTYQDAWAFGYCTNDAKSAGHFSGRQVSAMFRSMYQKLGILGNGGGRNEVFAYANDWWGDGSGDMLFIRNEYYEAFENWARS